LRFNINNLRIHPACTHKPTRELALDSSGQGRSPAMCSPHTFNIRSGWDAFSFRRYFKPQSASKPTMGFIMAGLCSRWISLIASLPVDGIVALLRVNVSAKK
jgi:hypothetical protein